MKRFWSSVVVVPSLALFLVGGMGRGGDEKVSPWKAFLSADVYKELSQRSVQVIEAAAKSDDKNAGSKIENEAAILVGYTLSIADPKSQEASTLRGAALQAARSAHKKEIGPLKDFAKTSKSGVLAPADPKLLKANVPAVEELMEIFRNKSKGGEGLHADLQYQPKLKNLNGIEALLGALSAKKLSEDNLAKVEKELPRLAYRIAVVAAITHELMPQKRAGEWRDFSIQMREASLALAEATNKKNADGILKAAGSLESSCTQCHSAFKGK
jgi:hypothetical protein